MIDNYASSVKITLSERTFKTGTLGDVMAFDIKYMDSSKVETFVFDISIDDNGYKKVGYIEGRMFKKFESKNNGDVDFSILEHESLTSFGKVLNMKKFHRDELKKYNFIYIDKIIIEDEYRNKGIGTTAMNIFLIMVKRLKLILNIKTIYLCSYPLDVFRVKHNGNFLSPQEKDYLKDKLNRFYERLEFNNLKHFKDCTYMYKRV